MIKSFIKKYQAGFKFLKVFIFHLKYSTVYFEKNYSAFNYSALKIFE